MPEVPEEQTTEVVPYESSERGVVKTIDEMFTNNSDKIQMLMSDQMTFDQFARCVVVAIKGNAKLKACSAESLIECCLKSAVVGLPLNTPAGEAYMIPRKGKAEFQLGYQGLITLAARQGIYVISLDCVREKDEFSVEGGTDPRILHKHTETSAAKRGEPYAFYSVHRLPTGDKAFTVMYKDEIEAIMDKCEVFEGKDSSWTKYPVQQSLKTVLKADLKRIPNKLSALSDAMQFDSHAEVGKTERNITLEAQIALPESMKTERPVETSFAPETEENNNPPESLD